MATTTKEGFLEMVATTKVIEITVDGTVSPLERSWKDIADPGAAEETVTVTDIIVIGAEIGTGRGIGIGTTTEAETDDRAVVVVGKGSPKIGNLGIAIGVIEKIVQIGMKMKAIRTLNDGRNKKNDASPC